MAAVSSELRSVDFQRGIPLKTYGRKKTTPLPLSAAHLSGHSPAARARPTRATDESPAAPSSIARNGSMTAPPGVEGKDSENLFRSPASSSADNANLTPRSAPSSSHARKKKTGKGQAKKAVKVNKPRKRRLPVNELIMVPSDVADLDLRPPGSSEEETDPIEEELLPTDCGRRDEVATAPSTTLSSLRKALRLPPPTNVLPPRKRIIPRSTISDQGCDGFATSELSIPIRQKLRKARKSGFVATTGTLELSLGPSPDIVFQRDELKSEVEPTQLLEKPPHGDEAYWAGTDQTSYHADLDSSEPTQCVADLPSRRKTRRMVTFEDQVIEAQLASISAPRRPNVSESESSSESSDGESASSADDECDQIGDDADAFRREDDSIHHHPAVYRRPDTERHSQRSILTTATLASRRKRKRRASIDLFVRENKLEAMEDGQACTPPMGQAHPRAQYRSWMEVREDIQDDYPVVYDGANQLQRDHNHVAPLTSRGKGLRRRPSSILKPSPRQPQPDGSLTSSALQRNTTSNRRRSLVDATASRYFSTAQRALKSPPPRDHSNTPRRVDAGSIPTSAQSVVSISSDSSSSDGEEEVEEDEEEDEGLFEAEQPHPSSSLNLLRKDGMQEWLSPRTVDSSRALGNLTRRISGQFGTSGIRRGPSLPFKPPFIRPS